MDKTVTRAPSSSRVDVCGQDHPHTEVDSDTGEPFGDGPDQALAIGLTHDVGKDVRNYVRTNPPIGRIVHVRLTVGASWQSIQCGRHAQMLADALLAELRVRGDRAVVHAATHIFTAGPNTFAFFLGPVFVYEFDFEGGRDGSYSPG
jgi:SMODS-associated and fused to various effectors sensor domain